MNSSPSVFAPKDLVVRDEGLNRLHRIRPGAARELVWSVEVPPGRDLQLVGGGQVLVGTDKGYELHDLETGVKTRELTSLPGALAARRLADGTTLVSGTEWQGNPGITFMVLDPSDRVLRRVNYPAFPYVRLVRPTAAGTRLFASNRTILEGDSEGRIVWQATLHTELKEPHAWKAFRLPNGQTLVSGGYAGNLQYLNADGSLARSMTPEAASEPFFLCDYQMLPGGFLVVVNWSGHGPGNGNKGHQLLAFDPAGRQVWHWRQDPGFVSALQGVLVLDGLDVKKLHVESPAGPLTPLG